jgi:NAD(P)H-hydrate epimerase
MRTIEERSAALGVSRLLLMENAGNAVAEFVRTRRDVRVQPVVVLAGPGNNGGDGFVAARHLAGYGAVVDVILLAKAAGEIRTEEAATNLRTLEHMPRTVRLHWVGNAAAVHRLRNKFTTAAVLVDAIFGTGLRGPPQEPYASTIDAINAAAVYTVAVDVPSGLDPTTGAVHERAVRADATVTFHAMKPGLEARADLAGEVVVAGIGVPPEAETA